MVCMANRASKLSCGQGNVRKISCKRLQETSPGERSGGTLGRHRPRDAVCTRLRVPQSSRVVEPFPWTGGRSTASAIAPRIRARLRVYAADDPRPHTRTRLCMGGGPPNHCHAQYPVRAISLIPVVWETLEPPSRSRTLPKNKRHLPNKGYRDDVAGDFTSNPTSGYSAPPSTARVANSETGENSWQTNGRAGGGVWLL